MKNVTIMYMKPHEKRYEITFRVIYVYLHMDRYVNTKCETL